MNIIFTCGGTGGHINPAIAVANFMRERHPDCKILFVGAKGHMEEQLVPKAGYDLECLNVSGLIRSKKPAHLLKNFKILADTAVAVSDAKKIIRRFKPDVILGTGGYACFPMLSAGASMKIPTCIHESNAIPGLTTKMVAKRVDKVLIAFAESAAQYKCADRLEVVGMPVRKEFFFLSREDARRQLGIGDEPLVVSAFGSLGARAMNKCMAKVFALEQKDGYPYRHIHATGKFGWEWMGSEAAQQGVDLAAAEQIDMREYIYDMPVVMAAADVIIGRAGAGSCNEIAASGTPAILVPSPNVAANHQEKNAKVLADLGGAVMIKESDCNERVLYDEINALLGDAGRRELMSAALKNWVIPDSAERICSIMEQLVRGK